LEENKKMKEEGGGEGLGAGAGRAGRRRGGGGASVDSLKSLTDSYEAKIAALNEERRELVMNSSSAAKNLQLAETKAWQLDGQVRGLQEEIRTLKLDLARAGGGDVDKENARTNRGEEAGADVAKAPTPSLLDSVQSVAIGEGSAEGQPECKQS
jgi:hypothetical protein